MTEFLKNIEDPEYYFGLACREHARVNLFFTLDMCHISNIRATCVMIKNGHFVASAPIEEVERDPIVWGTETEGYFTVRDADLVHCHFRSKVARIYNGPPNAIFLVFPFPKKIDHQQRRFSLRIPVREEEAGNFQAWYGEIGERDGKMPELRWRALEPPPCALGDISSSGLRLEISEKEPLAEIIDINDLVLLRGDFGAPGKPLSLSVLALVRRKMAGRGAKNIVNIGCHFIKWRKIQGIHGHSWFKTEAATGVPGIAQWISRNFKGVRG